MQEGGYVHAMPRRQCSDRRRTGGSFPKKLASPKISHESETVVGTLHYGSVLCVSATMGYKHHEIDPASLLKALARPNFKEPEPLLSPFPKKMHTSQRLFNLNFIDVNDTTESRVWTT